MTRQNSETSCQGRTLPRQQHKGKIGRDGKEVQMPPASLMDDLSEIQFYHPDLLRHSGP